MITNVLDAAFHTAHDFPGGVPALAQRMGDVSPNVLNKKITPKIETHHLRLDESVKMQSISGDFRILQAMAFSLNHVAIALPDIPELGDMGLLDGYMNIMRKFGELSARFQAAYADGDIDQDEFDAIAHEVNAVQGELLAWQASIKNVVR